MHEAGADAKAGWVGLLETCTPLGDNPTDRDLTGDLATAQDLLPVLADQVEEYEKGR